VVNEKLMKGLNLSSGASEDSDVPTGVSEWGTTCEAGVYVARVVDRKISRGEVFLITDGGLHHHLAASGNFGQVIRKNYPVEVGTRGPEEPREVASVVGPLCTPLDLLADRMELAAAEPGDLIVVYQSGAYGRTASPASFLSHPAVTEVLV